MHADCIEAVSTALGRAATSAEIHNIEARLLEAARQLAREQRPEWLAMSAADRAMAASERAAQNVAADAALKRRRVALTALRHDAIERAFAASEHDEITTLRHMLAFHAKGKGLSVESLAHAIRNEATGQLLEVFDLTRGKALGLLTDKAGARDLVLALHGDARASSEARAAAKQFHDVAERLRQRFVRAGGAIGKLDDWAMPHAHSSEHVARAGKDAWVAEMLAAANRDKYVHPDGRLMDDAELTDFLGKAWDTIAQDGANKMVPGAPRGAGQRANRHRAHRQLHFKDADAYLAYMQKYSDTPMLQTLLGHVNRMASDIALVETLGPNPDAMMQFWMDTAEQRMSQRDPVKTGSVQKELGHLQTLYDEVAGNQRRVASQRLAAAFDTYRSLNVASRLGSATLTSLADVGTQAVTAAYNGLPVTRVFMNELRSLNPASNHDRRTALRAGLGVQQFIASVNRWGSDGLNQEAQVAGAIARHAQGLAAATMKLSGMNALTGAGQQAFGSVMMDAIGSLSRAGNLAAHAAGKGADARLAKRLQHYGISDADFAVWQLAQPEDWRGLGDTVLTAHSIYGITDEALAGLAERQGVSVTALRETAATRLMAVVDAETNMAVVEPGARERAAMYGNSQRGEKWGEVRRSALQFKSFPIAMMMRHGARAMAQADGVGKAAYIAALVGTTTVLGGLALQINEVASGRDPRDMTDKKFWTHAVLKGGALGIYGDFLFADTTQYGQSIAAIAGGPILGDVETLARATLGNLWQVADGKDAKNGAAVQLLKGKTPFANLWYTKAATDQLQELASPGYTRRMQQRARREFNQRYFASPDGRNLRAPDWGRAWAGDGAGGQGFWDTWF